MDYQNKRGGKCVFQDIAKPTPAEWGSPLEAVMAALELEKKVNQTLLDLHAVVGKRNGPHLGDYLEGSFLNEQVDAIKKLSNLITKTKRWPKLLSKSSWPTSLTKSSKSLYFKNW